MSHIERAESVLLLAINEATEGHTAASGALIRGRVESCLSTALARCKEDPQEIYRLIDAARLKQETE